MMNISSVNTSAAFPADNGNYNTGSKKESAPDATVKPVAPKVENKVTEEMVKQSLDRILQAIQLPNTTIERSVHEGTKQVIYKVKDKESGEVIRQFPEEKLLDAAARIMELTGLVIDEKV